MIFEDIFLELLEVHYLVNSYYKSNILTFEKRGKRLNSNIGSFELENFYGLDLDSTLLDENVFSLTSEFVFDGVLRSIDKDVFKPFSRLSSIMFSPRFLLDLIRRQGIDWLRGINHDLDVI